MLYRSRSMTLTAVILVLSLTCASFVGLGGSPAGAQQASAEAVGTGNLTSVNWTWPVIYVVDGAKQPAMYQPIDPAMITKQWNICVSFPHLKDPYWLGANYGIVEEIRRDGATMQLFDAGGYTGLDTQISQLDDCVAQGADAIILSAISSQGVVAKVEEIVDLGIPVIDYLNGIDTPKVSAHALVSFYDMGLTTADYLRTNLVDPDETVQVAFFPGPQGAGWTEITFQGFQDGVKGSNIEITSVKWGDTGRDIQLALVEDELQANPDIDFIVGNAQAAVSAVQAVREAGLEDQVQILAFHQNPLVYDLIASGDLTGAPNDHTAVQGRIAVDMAIRLLEGQRLEPSNHVGPAITVMTPENLETEFIWESTFAPKDFQPVFRVG